MRTIAAVVLALMVAQGASAADYLVWSAVEGGGWKTDWLRVEGEQSEVLATRADLVLTDGSTLWIGQPTDVQQPTCPCEELIPGDTSICPPAAAGQALDLLELVSGSRVTVVEPSGFDVIGERQQSVEFLGAVGPYLFVGGSVYEYACGAHGAATNSFVVWNVARREVSAIVTEDELAAAGARERVKAWGVLHGAEGVDDAESPDALEWTMALPRYVDGRLQLQYQYTIWVPYAFSDGLWHSYSRSTRVPVAVLPRTLQPYTELPPAVKAFVETLTIDTDRPMPYGFGVLHANDVQLETISATFSAGGLPKKQHGSRRAMDPSGSYRGKIGELWILGSSDWVEATYTAVFGQTAHVCECRFGAGADGAGYRTADGRIGLAVRAGNASLTGQPDCCGAGWGGDEFERVGDLPSCAVSAKSFFHEDPDASTVRKAYVVSGDSVEILPAPFGAEEPFVYARFVGKRVTSGYLRTDTLTCD